MNYAYYFLLLTGRVVIMSSVRGRISTTLNAGYTMTKYALEAFGDALRQEIAQFGVKVVLIEPGNFWASTGTLEVNCVSIETRRQM